MMRWRHGINNVWLNPAHLLYRDLHAKVTAGHHDAIGGLVDLVKVMEAGSVLNLGYDLDLRSARNGVK